MAIEAHVSKTFDAVWVDEDNSYECTYKDMVESLRITRQLAMTHATKFPGEGKILGLQRSGTNFTTFLMKKNYNFDRFLGSHEAGWKHGPYIPQILGRETNLVIVVKHPLCWLVSKHRFMNQEEQFHDDFLHADTVTMVGFEEWVRGGYGFWIEYYNAIYRHWISYPLQKASRIVVRYEELIQNPEAYCDQIAKTLRLKKRDPEGIFYIPKGVMNKKNGEREEALGTFNKDYYLQQDYLDVYESKLLQYVKKKIDWELVKELGYKVT